MYARKYCVTIFVLISCSVICVDAINYVVTAPNIFRLNVAETVSVSVTDHARAVVIDVYIHFMGDDQLLSHQRLTVKPDEPSFATLTFDEADMPEERKDDELLFVNLVVKASKGEFPSKEVLVPVQKYSGYAFVQTDKPVYTPKEVVQIRILNLNDQMLPSDKPFILEIKNPDDQRILYQEFQPNPTGIIEHTFKFSVFPKNGTWFVSVLYGFKWSGKKTVQFKVEEYVLPKFSIKVISPDYVLSTSKYIETRVIAKYLFGKPVEGLVKTTFSIKTKEGTVTPFISYEGTLQNGERSVSVDIERQMKKKKVEWFPSIEGKQLLIEAEIVETDSGLHEFASNDSTIFAYSPYVISFIRSKKYFSPGIPYHAVVDVKYIDGRVAPYVNLRVVRAVSKSSDNNPRNLIRETGTTNEQGRVVFEFTTEDEDEELEIAIATDEEDLIDENQAENTLQIRKFLAPDGNSYISLNPSGDVTTFTVQDVFQTEVKTSFTITRRVKIIYLVVSRGVILHQGLVDENGRIKFSITPEMSPSARVIVYTVKNNKIIADSIKIEVKKTCAYNDGQELQLAARSSTGSFEPGGRVNIEVKGEADSYVGLLAVDEGVYLLNKKDVLSRQKMFNEMENQDGGCGFGGGKDTEEVFQRTGLIILTNAGINEHNRKETCDVNVARQKRALLPSLTTKSKQSTRIAAKCCRQGQSPGPKGMTCKQRADKIRKSIGDRDSCAQAFFDCCEKVKDRYSEGRIDFAIDSNSGLWYEELGDPFYEEPEGLRFFFPETWMFKTYKISSNDCRGISYGCKLTISETFPHSITAWRVQAVAVSQFTGMCIADSINIPVMKSIFLDMRLPYSAVRNEEIEVPVTVFNYGNEGEIKVLVVMTPGYKISMGTGKDDRKKIAVVPPNDSITLFFSIKPIEIGLHDIKVEIISVLKKDIVQKTLTVVAEGTPEIKVEVVPMDNSSMTIEPQVVEVPLPRDSIPETEKCVVSVIGNLMGQLVETTIEGIESQLLLQLPTGCGEQTMINLAPVVYTMMYLKKTGQLTPEIERHGYDLMKQGYSYLQNYRQNDGAFALWRNRAPTSWLTALIAKVLCQASQFITIPNDVSCGALDWLIERQHSSGVFYPYFDESGHQKTGNKLQNDVKLTAYALIAIKECKKCRTDKFRQSATKATRYLERNLNSLDNAYTTAIVTYALALVKSRKAKSANQKLKALSVTDRGGSIRYWKVNSINFDEKRADALSIETTSYALLAQLLLEDISYSHPIVHWLIQNRNERGAFVSTQDTIVALQAMAEYASLAKSPNINIAFDVINPKTKIRRSFNVTNENALTLQQEEIPCAPKFTVATKGQGVAVMSFAVHYNTKIDKCKMFDLKVKATELDESLQSNEVDDDIFDTDVFKTITASNDDQQVSEESLDSKQKQHIIKLDICVRHLGNEPAGMSILEIGTLTGYAPHRQDLLKFIDHPTLLITEFEMSDKIILYFDKVSHNKDTCIQLRMLREIKVGNLQPAAIKIYDYYEPAKGCQSTYLPGEGSSLILPDSNEEIKEMKPCSDGSCPGSSEKSGEEAACVGKSCKSDERESSEEIFTTKRSHRPTTTPRRRTTTPRRTTDSCITRTIRTTRTPPTTKRKPEISQDSDLIDETDEVLSEEEQVAVTTSPPRTSAKRTTRRTTPTMKRKPEISQISEQTDDTDEVLSKEEQVVVKLTTTAPKVDDGCPKCTPFDKIKSYDDQNNELLRFLCNNYDFVWFGNMVKKHKRGKSVYYDFHVTHVLKEGMDIKDTIEDEIVAFTARQTCKCSEMDEEKEYFIMGRDIDKISDMEYMIDENTSVREMIPASNINNRLEQKLQEAFEWFYIRMAEQKKTCSD